MLVTPAATSWSATCWAAAAGVAITPMAIDSGGGDGRQLGRSCRTTRPLISSPTRLGIGVEERGDAEPAAGETGVAGQRVTEVTDADQRDGAPLGEAEHELDLLDQQGDVVADAAGAVRAEVGEVLAQLGGVDPGGGGEPLAGDGLVPGLGEVVQRTQIFWEPGDGRLRQVRERRYGTGASGRARVTVLTHETPCGAILDPARAADRSGTPAG